MKTYTKIIPAIKAIQFVGAMSVCEFEQTLQPATLEYTAQDCLEKLKFQLKDGLSVSSTFEMNPGDFFVIDPNQSYGAWYEVVSSKVFYQRYQPTNSI